MPVPRAPTPVEQGSIAVMRERSLGTAWRSPETDRDRTVPRWAGRSAWVPPVAPFRVTAPRRSPVGGDDRGTVDWLRSRGVVQPMGPADPPDPEAQAAWARRLAEGCIPAKQKPAPDGFEWTTAPARRQGVLESPAPVAPPEPGTPLEDLVDAHSHLFVVAGADPATRRVGKLGHVVQGIVTERLAGMASRGLSRMVISGQVDPTQADRATDSHDLNRAIHEAARTHPEFFAPLANLVADAGTGQRWSERTALGDALAWGFRGVGEIFVHGHGIHVSNDPLWHVCRIADAAGVPVVFHWDLATVEDDFCTPAESMEQLRRLLGDLDRDGLGDTKIVIAHCGAGPDGDDLQNTDSSGLHYIAEYDALMTELLARSNVYFDLAGMQIGNPAGGRPAVQQLTDSSGPTTLGEYILGYVLTGGPSSADKFMVGLDVDPQHVFEGGDPSVSPATHHWGVNDYAFSISMYRKFLSPLPMPYQRAVLSGNATTLFG